MPARSVRRIVDLGLDPQRPAGFVERLSIALMGHPAPRWTSDGDCPQRLADLDRAGISLGHPEIDHDRRAIIYCRDLGFRRHIVSRRQQEQCRRCRKSAREWSGVRGPVQRRAIARRALASAIFRLRHLHGGRGTGGSQRRHPVHSACASSSAIRARSTAISSASESRLRDHSAGIDLRPETTLISVNLPDV